jgi:hypothetical protein
MDTYRLLTERQSIAGCAQSAFLLRYGGEHFNWEHKQQYFMTVLLLRQFSIGPLVALFAASRMSSWGK